MDVLRKCSLRDPEEPIARHMLAAMSGENVPSRASDAYVRKTFDSFADSFDEVLEGLHYRAPRLVAGRLGAVLDDRTAEREVLDAGCGTGLSGALLKAYASCLRGVDLSSAMLDKARERNIYDELVEAEITRYLRGTPATFDVVACVDTLVYFGALDEVLGAVRGALRPGGWVCFTVERTGTVGGIAQGYTIAGNGRYQHVPGYVDEMMARAGFATVEVEELFLRLEEGQAVPGLLVSGQRPPA